MNYAPFQLPVKKGEFGPLFDPPEDSNPLRIAAQEWMDTHPHAMALFERFALDAAKRGRKFGIALLTERIRWEYRIERNEGDTYKIANAHRAYIARELINRHPFLTDYMTIHATKDEAAA